MRIATGLRVSVLVSAVLALACSESTTEGCSPASCGTCCDSSGQCVPTVSPAACPTAGHGSACAACAGGETCYAGPGRCGPADPAFAFVTSATYDGNLAAAGSAANGLLGGDALCQSAAASAGLAGTFKAWLSGSGTNAIDRLTDVGGWYTVGPYPYLIFASKAQIPTGPTNAFRDEHGGPGPSAPVWTGTDPDGTQGTSFFQGTTGNCVGWTVSYLGADSGVTGSNGYTSGRWTDDSAQQCHNDAALYCFQQ